MAYFLRIGTTKVSTAKRYESVKAAKDAYIEIAKELRRYKQTIDATIHAGQSKSKLSEFPDWRLALDPSGEKFICEKI